MFLILQELFQLIFGHCQLQVSYIEQLQTSKVKLLQQ